MVASQNVDFGGANGLANILEGQQRQLDENGRASRYPFSAGPMGTFQIYPDPVAVDANGKPVTDLTLKYGDGPTLLSVQPGKNGQQQFTLFDHAGNAVLQSDDTAGYGLASPPTTGMLFQVAGNAFSSNAGSTTMHSGALPVINPAVQVQLKVNVGGGTIACTAAAQYVLTESTTGYSYTFPEFSATSTTGANTLLDGPVQAVVLPSSLIGKVLAVRIDARIISGSGSGNAIAATPIFVLGCSAATSNQINQIH